MSYVFVYGTLRKGEKASWSHALENERYVGRGRIIGFDMYDLGRYGAIRENEEDDNTYEETQVLGELYEILNESTWDELDEIEGVDIDLYERTPVQVQVGDQFYQAQTYTYAHRIHRLKKLPGPVYIWPNHDEIWYIAYGSNLELGSSESKTGIMRHLIDLPMESRLIEIPFDVCFRKMGGDEVLAFLDVSHPGFAYARAYRIRRSKLKYIIAGINHGGLKGLHERAFQINKIDGIKAITMTSTEPLGTIKDQPSASYLATMKRGLIEGGLSEEQAQAYLDKCLER